jgi:hypothetical protein
LMTRRPARPMTGGQNLNHRNHGTIRS